MTGRRAEPALRVASIVERPDPGGTRWDAAIALLLEAGRDGGEVRELR